MSPYERAIESLSRWTERKFLQRITNFKVHFLNDFCPFFLDNLKARQLLGLGVRFLPTPPPSPSSRLILDFKLFAQRIVFAFKRHEINFLPTAAPPPSSFFSFQPFRPRLPPPSLDELDSFLLSSPVLRTRPKVLNWIQEKEKLLNSFIFFKQKNPFYSKKRHNLSRSSRAILSRIRSDPSICISIADKNLGTVVYKRTDFLEECFSQLGEERFYKEIFGVSIVSTVKSTELALRSLLSSTLFKRTISPWLATRLLAHGNKLAHFYIIWKLHKTPVVGRPIVSNIHWVTANISRWIDAQLQPFVQKHRFVLTDTTSLCSILNDRKNDPLPDNCLLFTFDVSSLYTNIDWDKGLHALLWFLQERTPLPINCQQVIMSLSRFILENNYFSFEDKIFKQTNGVAMGTPFAVVFAVIYMLWIEENFVFSILECCENTVFYKRYIDDGFGIWRGNPSSLQLFIDSFSSHALTLNFEISETSVDFLDITIFKEEKFLRYKLFAKPLNLYLYPPFSSFHPAHVKKGFIKAELIRFLLRNCRKEDYFLCKKLFYQRLRARGYPPSFLSDIFKKILWEDRDFYFSGKKTKKPSFKGCVFVSTLGQDSKHLVNFLSLDFGLLGGDDDCLPLPKKALFAFRNPPALGPIMH